MRRFGFLFCLLLCSSFFVKAQVPPGLCFISNNGQWEEPVRFRAYGPGATVFLEDQAITYLLYDKSQYNKLFSHPEPSTSQDSVLQLHALRFKFEGSQKPVLKGVQTSPTYYNYLIGNDKSRWASRVPLHGGIIYQDLYPGIDLSVKRVGMNIKLDWIIHPGADPSRIRIKVEGADDMQVAENKSLYLFTQVQTLIEQAPVSYSGDKTIPTAFELKGNQLSFKVGNYDTGKDLIIDPLLIFSTYSGSTSDNFGFTATYDSKGNFYSGGIAGGDTSATNRYPTTPGAFQRFYKGGTGGAPVNLPCDITLSKYTPDGDTLLWATYMGGSRDDYPHSLVADHQDRLVIMGSTFSNNFPMPAAGYDLNYHDLSDMIISKLSEDGTTLVAGTYLGGNGRDAHTIAPLRYNYADDFRGDVTVDLDHNIWVASCTASGDFPLVNSNFQSSLTGPLDGILIKMDSSLQHLQWSNLVGGQLVDALYSIKITPEGQVMVAGGTQSNNLKGTAGAAFSTAPGGTSDGFIAKFDQNQNLIRTTYFGTSGYDQIYFVEFDNSENIFATGQTDGSMTTTAGRYGSNDKGQFVVKFSADLTQQIFVSNFGSTTNSPNFSPSAFLIDRCENIYISGWGSDLGSGHRGTTNGLPVTPDAFQSSTDGNDFYLIVLNKDAMNMVFASYFGGNNSEDHVDGGTSRFDKKGVVYQSVCASCISGGPTISDFPTTPSSYSPLNVSPRCSNAAFKIDLQVSTTVIADFDLTPKVGCFPLEVHFTNKSTPNAQLLWRFGDGTTDTTANPVHTFNTPGSYKIWLIATDTSTCNRHDSTYRYVQVLPSPTPDFEVEYHPCENRHVFINKSKNSIKQRWDFGDGQTDTSFTPVHFYTQNGTYKVRLLVNEGFDCEKVLEKTIRVTLDSARKLEVPNAFSPNGDGINEKFEIRGLNETCDAYHIRIYNRWGQLLFESDRIGDWWTGAYNNAPAAPGVYYFVLDLERFQEKPVTVNGSIHLLMEKANQ